MKPITAIYDRTVASRVYPRLTRFFQRDPNRAAGLQLAPTLFWILFFLGGAFIMVIVYSVSTDVLIGDYTFTTEHYESFFANDLYLDIFRVSLIIAVETTIVNLLIAYPVAYYIAVVMDTAYKRVFLLLFIIPFWTNVVLRVYAWRLVFNRQGFLNYLGHDILHIVGPDFSLLSTRVAVIIGLSHVFLPYMILPIYSSLEGIDHSQIEAAKNLGANKIEAFFEVTFPQSLPGSIAGATLVFVLAFGSFVTPRLLGGERNLMIANIIATLFRRIQAWEIGSAISVVFVVVAFIIVYTMNRLVGLEELYGGGDRDEA